MLAGAAPAGPITAEAARMRHRSVTDQPTGFHSSTDQEAIMAKGQKRSSREPKKPKAEKPKPATGATSILKEKPGSGSRTWAWA